MKQSTPTFDIFVGGPMIAKDDPRRDALRDAAGGLIADHIANLRDSLRQIAEELNRELDGELRIRVFTPPLNGGAGMIPSEVFDRIDECDMGIFDCSGPAHKGEDGSTIRERASPNVIYELGLMHALGLVTLTVDIPGADIFYLNQCYNALVPNFDIQTLTNALREPVRSVIDAARSTRTFYFSDGLGADEQGDDDQGTLRDPTSNPLSSFYHMPLVELASSTGLATGYFRNFVLDIFENRMKLKIGAKTPDEHESRHAGERFRYKKIVILEPDELEETEDVRDLLLDMLKTPEIEALNLPHETVQLVLEQEGNRTRTKSMAAIGPYLYDIPTTLIATTLSPRYEKIVRWKAGKQPDRSGMIRKRETEIKRAFFATLRRLAEQNPRCPNANDYIRVLTVEEFRERLFKGEMDKETRM